MFLLSSAIAGVRWQLRQSERANSETRCGRCTSVLKQQDAAAESFTIAAASQVHKIARIIKSHTFDVRTRGTGMHGFERRATDARDCKGARRDDVQCAAGTDARVVNECLFQGAAASAAEPQNSVVKLVPSCMRLLHNV